MKETSITNLLLVIFFGLTAFLIIPYHEMWRDELQAWLIAKNSASILELLANVKYEGSGVLWHLLIYPLTKASLAPESMQYLHISISTLTVLVIAKWSPFTTTQKILLCFGYFIFYEYSLIARNYAIGTLLIFLFCALFPKRNIYPIRLALVLGLLFHTSAFGLIVGICLMATVIFEDFMVKKWKEEKINIHLSKSKLIAITLAAIGLISAILQIIPPSDGTYASEWHFYPSLSIAYHSYVALVSAYFPLPILDINFWNNTFLTSNKSLVIVNFPLIILTLYLFLRFFIAKPSSLFFFSASSFALILFFYVKFGGDLRHHGFLFITLISSIWIYHNSKSLKLKQIPNFLQSIRLASVNPLINIILAVHFLSSIIALSVDYRFDFSSARQTADFLKMNKLTDSEIIGYSSSTMIPISGYLEGKEIFFLDENRYGTYKKWNLKKMNDVNSSLINSTALDLSLSEKKVLLILNSPVEEYFNSNHDFKKIFESNDSVIKDEKFYVYDFISAQ